MFLAWTVAVLHGAAVLFMLVGGLLALRWPRLLWLHVPIALAILVTLFWVQRHGTASVGRVVGPIMACWFLVLGALGLASIAQHPQVLLGVHPNYALWLFLEQPHLALLAMGFRPRDLREH